MSGAHQKSSGSAGAAEDEEGDDQSDVGRVEQRAAAVPDDVLRQQREGRHAGEHVPLVGGPVVAGRRGRDAQDERHATAGEHRAGRPHDGAGRSKADRHADDGSGQDRRQDLRDADLEVQAHLPQRVDGDDDRGHVQARVADLREHQGVRVPTDPEGATRRTCHGGRSVTLLGRNNRLGPSGGRSSHVGR